MPDAVFFRDSTGRVLHELFPAPSKSDLHDFAQTVSVRAMRYLARKGLIQGDAPSLDQRRSDPTAIEVCLGSSVGLGQLAKLKGKKVKQPSTHVAASVSRRTRSGAFNIHTGVTATQPEARERLVRYCARAPLSLERLSVSRCGKVVYQLRHPIGAKTHRERKWEAARLDWTTLLKRVYDIDALACPCGGRLTFIELIESKKKAVRQLIARGLHVEPTVTPKGPVDDPSDHVDEIPTDDWDQSSAAPDFTPDPTWDDP